VAHATRGSGRRAKSFRKHAKDARGAGPGAPYGGPALRAGALRAPGGVDLFP